MSEPNIPGLSQADPKNLIRESFRIEGITLAECRSIFVDWALSLPEGIEPAAAMQLLIDTYGSEARPAGEEEHPMITVLTLGQSATKGSPQRRGGRAGRFSR